MYYPDVPALDPEDIELLCNEYIAHNKHLDPHIADRLGVKRGLRNPDGTGVLAGITNVSSVIGYEKLPEGTIRPISGRLVYRGIDIDTLAAEADKNDRFMFEEVVWLLLFGALPTQEQYARFCKLIDEHRELPKGFADDMIMNSPSPNIMNKMARSVLSMYSYDEHADDLSLPNILTQSINLIAELPTMMVNAYQLKRRVYDHESMYFHYPIAGQSTAEHILSSYRADQKFTHEEARLLDLCLLVHADHGGGNNSTFTTHVVTSSGTDTYSTMAAAMASLKGPKHGGANIKVTQMFEDMKQQLSDWEDEDAVRAYLCDLLDKKAFDKKGLIYGMGHAVYSVSDPRADIFKKFVKQLAKEKGYEKEYALYELVEHMAPEVIGEKRKIYKGVNANVDFYSGLVYSMLNLPKSLYTPIFAAARIVGWSAHRLEELKNVDKIIRPAYKALADHREYIPLEER